MIHGGETRSNEFLETNEAREREREREKARKRTRRFESVAIERGQDSSRLEPDVGLSRSFLDWTKRRRRKQAQRPAQIASVEGATRNDRRPRRRRVIKRGERARKREKEYRSSLSLSLSLSLSRFSLAVLDFFDDTGGRSQRS